MTEHLCMRITGGRLASAVPTAGSLASSFRAGAALTEETPGQQMRRPLTVRHTLIISLEAFVCSIFSPLRRHKHVGTNPHTQTGGTFMAPHQHICCTKHEAGG